MPNRSLRRTLPPVALVALSCALVSCKPKGAEASAIETTTAERQSIVVDVEATGVIAPMNAVEVRSKASGQIIAMPVQTGSKVKPGDLLVRIDARDPQSRYNQALAAIRAAQANVDVTKVQYERAQTLQKQQVITAPELEQARVAYAQATSQLATAQTNLQLARIALEDVTIRSPVAGTIITKNVSLGQVIASATNSASGGTLLLSLADLSVVYDSALVSESDIGKVRPGLPATVTVDAYPNRVFRGSVEKIEPQATVQQSVTMFPVLIRLENPDGALMPGMNSDVSVLIQRADSVVAVSNDAITTPRDAASAAVALGMDPASVTTALRSQVAARTGTDSATRPGADTGSAAGRTGRSGRVRGAAGGEVDGGARAGRAGGTGAETGAGVGARGGARRMSGGGRGFGAGGRFGAGATTSGVVFVKQGTTFVPRTVRLGVRNYDVTEIASGLKEGEEVALVTAAKLQQAQTETQERIRSRTALPGMQQQTKTGAGSGGGGSGRPPGS